MTHTSVEGERQFPYVGVYAPAWGPVFQRIINVIGILTSNVSLVLDTATSSHLDIYLGVFLGYHWCIIHSMYPASEIARV